MTDLLNPKVAKEWQQRNESLRGGVWFNNTIDTLCRNYLTLWDRVQELEKEVKSIRGLKQSVDEALNMGDGSYRP